MRRLQRHCKVCNRAGKAAAPLAAAGRATGNDRESSRFLFLACGRHYLFVFELFLEHTLLESMVGPESNSFFRRFAKMRQLVERDLYGSEVGGWACAQQTSIRPQRGLRYSVTPAQCRSYHKIFFTSLLPRSRTVVSVLRYRVRTVIFPK